MSRAGSNASASVSPQNVLFVVRESLSQAPGGDTVQIGKTAAALRKLGVSVTIVDRLPRFESAESSESAQSDLSQYDCVHLWHLERLHENYAALLRVKRAGAPIVLSPIYWPASGKPLLAQSRVRLSMRGVEENLKNLVRFCMARSHAERAAIAAVMKRGWLGARRDLLESAAVVLPNSQAEAGVLSAEARSPLRVRVVPNAIEPDEFADSPAPQRSGVLCVGHFDPRKNQYQVIRALRDSDVEVTFVGGPRSVYRNYYRRCRNAAGPNMRFLGPQPASEVRRLMNQAQVHVCPSHFETPGLANLEAAAAGCGLALGESPPVREYFGEDAIYFDSRDRDAMRAAVEQCLDTPVPRGLRERVLAEFNWSRAAECSLEGYQWALRQARAPRYTPETNCAQESTMRATSFRLSSGYTGSTSVSRAADSVSGKSPSR